MFFLIILAFIAQIVILINFVVFAIIFDIKINMFRKKILELNPQISVELKKIEDFSARIKEFCSNLEIKIRNKRNILFLKKMLNILEWCLLLKVKPENRKFVLGYKLSKALVVELSSSKNML